MNEYFDGATIWARKTIESDIFFWKPAEWFKIWFYIVSKVNHKDTKQFKRGEGFFNFENEKKQICVSDDQIKKFLQYGRRLGMLRTKRSTRGTIVTVCKYALYQDLGTYKSTKQSTREAREKHERSTPINKYEKNEIISKDITKPIGFDRRKVGMDVFASKGNAAVSSIITRLEQHLGGKLDGSVRNNRNFASHLLKKYTHEQIEAIFKALPLSKFWAGKITSTQSLYNHASQIINSLQDQGGKFADFSHVN